MVIIDIMPLTLSLVDKGIEHMNHFFEVLKKNYCIYHLYEKSLLFLQRLFSHISLLEFRDKKILYLPF